MKIINKYEAEDGTIFDNEEQCLEYERAYKMNERIMKFHNIIALVKDNPIIIEFLNNMKDYCKMHGNCDTCLLYNLNCPLSEYPYEWEVDKFVAQIDKSK